MSEQLSDDELDLIRKHRAEKAKQAGRKVRVRGKHDSGAEYEFDLEGDEAERVISRHKDLWAADDEGGDGSGEDGGEGGDGGTGKAAGNGKAPAGTARKPAYFRAK